MKQLDTFSKRVIVIAASIVAIFLSASIFVFSLAAMPKSYAKTGAPQRDVTIQGYTIVGAVDKDNTIYAVGVKTDPLSPYYYEVKTFSGSR